MGPPQKAKAKMGSVSEGHQNHKVKMRSVSGEPPVRKVEIGYVFGPTRNDKVKMGSVSGGHQNGKVNIGSVSGDPQIAKSR